MRRRGRPLFPPYDIDDMSTTVSSPSSLYPRRKEHLHLTTGAPLQSLPNYPTDEGDRAARFHYMVVTIKCVHLRQENQ